MTLVLEVIALYALGAIAWFFLSFLITVTVMAFTRRLSLITERSEGESEPFPLGRWLVQWFLLWPATVPLVLWAAFNGMTLADLKRHFQAESKAKSMQGSWRKVAKTGWVYAIFVPTGIVVTHAIVQRPTKWFESKMFEMSRVGAHIPFNEALRINPSTLHGLLHGSLSEAKASAESDKDFLEECKRKS